ncbi:hypothetical protein BD779DRAFT_1642922 [Infundibulicybe gibba]|nr:hypothetical protein BD779DRAFT_1642922 [Infundibulicybe gibba]
MASETQIEEQPPRTTKDTYFSDTDDADIILHSSDNVEFHTHRILLSLASPLFKDMFTLPQNPTMETDMEATQHIIPMSENSCVLRHFLTWCDPRTEFVCDKWADIPGVLKLADKYDVVSLRDTVKRMIMSSYWIRANPLGVYAIATEYQFDDLACRAARSSLKLFLGESLSVPEMGSISAIDFHDLLRYHHKCGKKAMGATTDLSWMQPGAKEIFKQHNQDYSNSCCSSPNRSRYPGAGVLGIVTWLYNHLTLVGQRLLEKPAGTTVEQLSLRPQEKWEPFKQAAACSLCSSTWRYNISRFNADLSAEIEKRIDTVPFEFTPVPLT